MADRVIRIDREHFRLVATVYEGQSLHFASGTVISVEKHDMRPGGTEFDFQVTSRPVRNGRPDDIMARRRSLDDEFVESRVKTNILGLPVSLGNAAAMARDRRLELTYGEARPQVFRSRVSTPEVAWRIWFKRAHYAGAARRPALRVPRGAATGRLADQAQTRADASASAGAATSGGARGEADGRVGPLELGAMLRVYVLQSSPYRPYGRPFGRGDMIFDDPTWFERARRAIGL